MGRVKESIAEYYDRRGVLPELEEGAIEFSLEEELRRQILEGKRTRRLQNISIKLDPAQIQALKKITLIHSRNIALTSAIYACPRIITRSWDGLPPGEPWACLQRSRTPDKTPGYC